MRHYLRYLLTGTAILSVLLGMAGCTWYAEPHLKVDGAALSSRMQGGVFRFTGSGFLASSTATKHTVIPSGEEMQGPVAVLSDGSVSWDVETNCAVSLGAYSVWVSDARGMSSDRVTQVVLSNPSCVIIQPNLRIDGGVVSTRMQGEVFRFTGSGFLESSTATKHIITPSGAETQEPVAILSDGSVSLDVRTDCALSSGTYSVWVSDARGMSSNQVTQVVTANPSCDRKVLLRDTFGGNLETLWSLFGSPRPAIRTDIGNPAPSFENNGDSMYDSGAVSRSSFDYSAGLVIEADFYVDAEFDGCWVSSSIGLLQDLNYSDAKSASYSVRFSSGYSGSLCNSHGEGNVGCEIITESGDRESYSITHDDRYLRAWHNFKISIESSRQVSFYIDDILFYKTTGKLSLDHNNMPLLLGNRSSQYGTALHDNVEVSKP
jgi:hypothetical protein